MEPETALIRALMAARNGRHIGWVSPNSHALDAAFTKATNRTIGAGHKIRRARGKQSITTPNGGTLQFMLPAQVIGTTLDKLCVYITASEKVIEQIEPALATTGGTISYYT